MRVLPAPRPIALTVARAQSLCVFYVLLWCLFPPLAIDTVWRLLLFAAFAVWFALEGLRNGLSRLANAAAALTLLFLGYTTLVQVLIGGPADVIRAIQLDICLVCALIGIAYRGARLKELEWLVLPLLGVLTLSIGLTLQALAENPHAARLVVRTSDEALALLRAGVGGYQLVYANAVLAPLLFLTLLRGFRLSSLFSLAVAVTFGAAILLVFSAGYSIAVLTLLTGMAVCLLAVHDGHLALAEVVVAVIALLLVLLALDPFLAYGEMLANGTKYAKKLADLRQSISLGESVGTASDRATRYLRSMSLFLESPVFGVLSYDRLGKHSQILDTFARYGGLIGILGVFVLVRLPALLIAPMPRGSANAPLVMMTTITIFLMLNKATAAHGAVVYLVAPMISFAYGRRAFARASARRAPAAVFGPPDARRHQPYP